MFQVTEAAVDRMAEMRSEREIEPDQGMVLVVGEDSQLAVAVGAPQENDQVYERDGEPVVIVPAQLTPTLDGLVLDHSPEGFTVSRAGDE
jgi:Fe-S cluster assembly iron-binding protein IscA